MGAVIPGGEPMGSDEIRRRFLAHFERHDHTVVPSASLLADDPTLLLVNAGMVPFKPYLLGEQPAPYPRAASVQKCVRTNDIENVGRTSRHGSFFEMCGNFSFGDYFKERAIPLAWELLTRSRADGGYGFPEDRLWPTVYLDDDEAADLWLRVVGVPPERLQRRGREDNYWSMSVPGPCGPCSEIYYDRGPAYGREGGPVADENRYLEVWNLVFMQYLRGPGAGYDYVDHLLGDLPARSIDTGMGLERMATVLQGVDNLYETDLLAPVLDQAQELTNTPYGVEDEADVSLRVVAEHARTVVMLVADGVVPGNEGRGYVLRRMLRRAVRNARQLGAEQPLMGELAEVVRGTMGPAYPAIQDGFARIRTVVDAEEQAFLSTLRTGTTLFDVAAGETKAAGQVALPAERAFALHDTYGFPIDLTLEMAAEQGLEVDEAGFRRLMEEQRSRAQAAHRERGAGHTDVSAFRSLLDGAGPTVFTGYGEVVTESSVRGMLLDGEPVDNVGGGTEVLLVLDRTPFYAEAGGQLADAGRLILPSGSEVEVVDVQRPVADLVVHTVRVARGEITVGSSVQASVDVERRRAISRAHTATHLVHTAFRRALGESATQAGSQNAPGRLRFDFASPTAVPPSALADVEDEINAVLIDDLVVRAFVTSQDEARRIGAMALFGEKYGERVRVVEVGDYARELCGGTHAARSGQLGLVKLLGEASIGAGVRRVEGLVGLDAFRFLAREHVLVSQLSESLKARPEELPERVAALVSRVREVERSLERVRAEAVLRAAGGLAAGAHDVFGVTTVTHEVPEGTAADDVRRLALDVRGRLPAHAPAVVAMAARADGRALVVLACNETARTWGVRAGELMKGLAPALGGGGGGKDDVAQGGGPRGEGIAEALRLVDHLIAQRVTGGD